MHLIQSIHCMETVNTVSGKTVIPMQKSHINIQPLKCIRFFFCITKSFNKPFLKYWRIKYDSYCYSCKKYVEPEFCIVCCPQVSKSDVTFMSCVWVDMFWMFEMISSIKWSTQWSVHKLCVIPLSWEQVCCSVVFLVQAEVCVLSCSEHDITKSDKAANYRLNVVSDIMLRPPWKIDSTYILKLL